MIRIKATEDVAHQWELLAHGLSDLLQDSHEIEVGTTCVRVSQNLLGVLIAIENFELVVVYLDDVSWQQVLWLEDPACDLIQVHRFVQELARHNTQVALRWLVNGQGVVEEREVHHKEAINILRLWIGVPCGEAQDFAIVVEKLLEVLLRWLWNQVNDGAHGVIPRAVAVVWRRDGARLSAIWKLDIIPFIELVAQNIFEVLTRELVRIVDEETGAHQGHVLADVQVMAVNKLGLLLHLALRTFYGHSSNWHPTLTEEDREVVSAAIQWVLLANLNLIVGQEEEDLEWAPLELWRRQVVHDAVETKNLPVHLEELLHVSVDVATTEHDLAVHLLIGTRLRSFLHLECILRPAERIVLHIDRSILFNANLVVVVTSERITIHNSNCPSIYFQVTANSQILWLDVGAIWSWEAVSADQLTLRNSAVVLTWLDNLTRVVLEIIIDCYLPDAVVFQICLHHCLLEVAVESEHMPVEGVPSWQFAVLLLLTRVLEHVSRGAVWQGTFAPLLYRLCSAYELGFVV